jgi:ubiquinone biosynthesis protein UbiJ
MSECGPKAVKLREKLQSVKRKNSLYCGRLGHGQMKPEQLEIAQFQREVARLKAERDILKKPRPTSRRNRHEVRFCETLGDLAGGVVVRGARCLARWILYLADTTAQSAQSER